MRKRGMRGCFAFAAMSGVMTHTLAQRMFAPNSREGLMLDHVGLKVTDLRRSRDFFDKALKPLGITVLYEGTGAENGGTPFIGYGEGFKPYFWLNEQPRATEVVHVAFAAESRAKVDAFYAAAMAAGGRDFGAPGPRPHYHPHYYGAFVLDPDGHNIEAVCHTPA